MSWGLLESREARRWLAAIAVLGAVGACDMDYGELFAGAGGDTGGTGGSGGTGGTGGDSGGGGATGGGSGTCGPCESEERCHATLGCVECIQSAHCHSPDPHCAFFQCEECREDQHCSPDNCHYAVGVCGAACVGANGCSSYGAADICSNGHCVECEGDGDCDSGLVCNTGEGRCLECADDDDCADPTPHCSAVGSCAECLLNEHCDAADQCVARQCEPR